MRMKNWLVVSVAGCVLLLGSARAFAQPVTGQVFQLNVTLSVMAEDDSGATPKIVKQTVTTQYMINLALGNSPIATVPPNEVLALVVSAEAGQAAVIVLNTTTTNNLKTIAVFDADGVGVKGKGTAVMGGSIEPGGNGSNGLSGGFLAMSGSITASPTNQHVLTSFKGKIAIGAIQGAAFGNAFNAIISKGAISTVGALPFSLPIPELP